MDLRKDPDSQDTSNPIMGNELLDWNAMVDRWEKTGVFGDMPPALKQQWIPIPIKGRCPQAAQGLG